MATVYGKRLDFSSVPLDPQITADIIYCVPEDQSAVFFFYFYNFYRSDLEMTSPKLLFSIDEVFGDALSVDTLISFPDTGLLFFRGWSGNGNHGIGSIQPDTKAVQFMNCTASEIVLCNTGVMLYDYDAVTKNRPSTAVYWENGDTYQIPLQNPKESETRVSISPNGKYICTIMNGTASDGRLTERCSVYDVKKGTFISSFDWTFDNTIVTRTTGFRFVRFDEEAKCLYVEDSQLSHDVFRFDFGV